MIEAPSASTALAWTERLTALALVLQTVELLVLRWTWSDDGIWRWALLAPEHRSLVAPVRWLLGRLLPARPFAVLLGLRLLAALALAAGVGDGLAPFLLLTQVAIGVRFRGTFNGGSDALSVVLLCALSLAQLVTAEVAQKAALIYVAVQLTLSYVVAGVGKLRHAEWRSGRALALLTSGYGAPRWLARAFDGDGRVRLLSWSVLVFEVTFPLAWSGPAASAVFLGLGLCFHLATWLLFGLNRFVFVWAAGYPALFWCSELVR